MKSHSVATLWGSSAALALSPRARFAFSALAAVALGLAVLLPTLAIGYWLAGPHPAMPGAALPWVGIATAMLHLAPLSWGLIRLRICLAQFASGHPFAAEGIAGLRDFALGTGVSALMKPLSGLLFTLALGWQGGPKRITIDISSDVMILALFAGVVASLAWAMERAALLAEENSQFV
ncbi:hypothetical protein [Ancylobacter sp. IITR112]|uniref:hypothetical protein n=1 Tax=Ancylobacter sp. IITR112 TaxID=3138073 RepID=UPI00352AC367